MCGNGYADNAQWTWDTGVILSQNDSSAKSELSGGTGYYSGAVNARIFGTEHLKTEDNNKPYCGHSCGTCYDLMTTGINAYSPPVDSASVITIMIVDACYNQNGDPWWCNSLYEAQDKYGCDVHFDIQTDRYNENLAAKGKDYMEWTGMLSLIHPFWLVLGFTESNQGGGQVVAYKKRDSCPEAMTKKFEEDCKPYCSSY